MIIFCEKKKLLRLAYLRPEAKALASLRIAPSIHLTLLLDWRKHKEELVARSEPDNRMRRNPQLATGNVWHHGCLTP